MKALDLAPAPLATSPSLGAAPQTPTTVAVDLDRLVRDLERMLDVPRRRPERWRERVEPWIIESAAEEIARFSRDGLHEELRGFRRGALPESCPEHARIAARVIAAFPKPKSLLGAYRISHMVLWDAWLDLVEGVPGLSAAQRRELLRHGSDYFFAYADLLNEFLAEAYRKELGKHGRSSERRRFEAISGVLEGDPFAASSLDFDLERHHLGLIAWGEEPGSAAQQLAGILSRPLLAVSPLEPQSCWAWVSGSHPLDRAQERALAGFEPTTGHVALGLEAFGEAGFRATHRQALRACRFAGQSGPSALRYEDVVVEALASENEDDARAFVAHELRGIEDDSLASRRIRETLEAYFTAGYNAACAAATLGVHQQTVANRLRTAEERLGQKSIGVRRVELEIALRLRACLAREESSLPAS